MPGVVARDRPHRGRQARRHLDLDKPPWERIAPESRRRDAILGNFCLLAPRFSIGDHRFGRRLHSRMLQENLRVWFDDEDMKGGRELHPQIDEAIRLYDKFLLVLSEASMNSRWVKTEVRRAWLAEQ